jgi:hypothetical protein
VIEGMVEARYKRRYAEVYLPSEKFLEKWKDQAEAAKMALSAWIFAAVEASTESMNEPAQEIASQKNSLQDENRKLRRDLEKSEARLRELDTQLYKLQHTSFLRAEAGQKEHSERLVDVLRSGNTWSSRALLEELGVNQSDADAIQIVSNQLQALQDFRLVSENSRGWKWIR